MSEVNIRIKKKVEERSATLFCGRKVTLNLKAPLNGLISHIIEDEMSATPGHGH